MRKILVTLLSTVAMMGIASLAFAADGAPVKLDSASLGLAIVGCANGMADAAAGCGIGQAIYSLVVNLIILFANPFI